MSREIRITPQADSDLDEQFDYIAERNPAVAARFYASARATFEQIAQMPGIGAVYPYQKPQLAGMQMLPITGFANYLVFYLTNDESVQIVRVLHGARKISNVLGASD